MTDLSSQGNHLSMQVKNALIALVRFLSTRNKRKGATNEVPPQFQYNDLTVLQCVPMRSPCECDAVRNVSMPDEVIMTLV
jgi:hypothetical protein